MTITLERVAARRPHEMPPVLTVEEVTGVLAGRLSAPTPGQVRARLALDYHRRPDATDDANTRLFGPQHSSSTLLPVPRLWPQRFATALVECLAGRRPPSQLLRHMEPDAMARVNRRYRTATRRGVTPGLTRVLRVRVCEPCDGIAEVAVVARINGRPSPIALRLHGADGRWKVTVLEML